MKKKEKIKKKQRPSIFTKTIQRQILIPFLTLIVIAGIVVGIASYSFSVDNTTAELTDNVEEQMKTLSQSFDIFLEAQEDTINYYSGQEEFLNIESDPDAVIEELNDIRASNDIVQNAYVGMESEGTTVSDDELKLPDDFDARTRPWYQDAVDNAGSLVWTEPYLDVNTEETIMSVAKAVQNGDELVGVFSIDINMSSLLRLIDGVKIADSGYAAIFAENGIFISHPQEDLVGTDITENSFYTSIMNQNKQSGVISYQYEGKDKTLGYSKNDITGWIIIGTVDKADLEQQSAAIIIPIAITVLIILLLSIIAATLITRRIRKPIVRLQSQMKEVEEGNLTIDLRQNREDEIGQLAGSTHEMKEGIRQIILQLQGAVESVRTQSSGLRLSANEVQEGSEQIASTMEQLSAGAESQAHSSSKLSEMMEAFTTEIREAYENGKGISESSGSVLRMTNEGSDMMRHSVDQMQTIDRIVKESVDKVRGLDSQSQQISKLVQVIQDIANQTNLLSLNAAIEAARAGEHGKGFAVVADEVRKLAEQVSHSVEDITSIVDTIQTESGEVAATLQNGYKEVDQGTTLMKQTGETFDKIQHSVTDMVARTREISAKLQKISEDSYEMNTSIEEVASVSEESAAGVEQVTAAAQQSNSSVEEVSNSAEDLAELSNVLNDQIKRFKVD
ncbi:methyl-accepting chemotaxis protein [Halobacillus sp. KGW1]|uniref:methyl-accepting chemotaxis protein n=1 Tax=Halobacillus sp. KGW1 TaxID=1793726 RepID=UPI0009ED6E13|nr:methyl-accepting chemotaxis protein [Halobacillus sp. KGW1]